MKSAADAWQLQLLFLLGKGKRGKGGENRNKLATSNRTS